MIVMYKLNREIEKIKKTIVCVSIFLHYGMCLLFILWYMLLG